MAETLSHISKITLPSGNSYLIKDAAARTDIAALQDQIKGLGGAVHMRGVVKTPVLVDGAAVNNEAGYAIGDEVVHDIADGDILLQGGKEFLVNGGKLYETGDLSGLGELAYANEATGPVEVNGTAAAQVFAGEEATLSPEVTQGDVDITGTVVANGNNAESVVTIVPQTTNIYSITGVGTLPTKAADTFTQGSQASFTEGEFSKGTLPELTTTVADEELTIGFSAGTLPSKEADTFVANTLPTFVEGAFTQGTLPTRSENAYAAWTGYDSATAAAQKFTGASADINASGKTTNVAVKSFKYTPAGTNTTSSVNATGTVTVAPAQA